MIPAIVTQVADRTTAATRGTVNCSYERTFRVHAGPASRSDHMIFQGVYDDGVLVGVHVVEDTLGGVAASAAQREQTENEYEHPKPGDLFRAPWDARFLGEYTYRIVDPATVAFSSLVNDTAHGDGTFTVDAQGDVLTYQYAMSANLQYVTRSTISGERSEVLPGYWAMTHEHQQYWGNYKGIAGGATTEIAQTAFHR